MKKFFCLFFLFFIILAALSSLELDVRINQVVSDKFPTIRAYVSVFDKETQEPVTSLQPSAFTIMVDGNIKVNSKPSTDVFFHEDEPISYYVLLDSSGLMEDYFGDQKNAAKALIENIRPDLDLYTLYHFSQNIEPIYKYENHQDVMTEAFADVEVLGGSPNLFDSIIGFARTIDGEKENTGRDIRRKAMIVLSDGRDEGSQYTEKQFFELMANRANQVNKEYQDFPIYTLGMVLLGMDSLNTLESIADHTGGNYKYTFDPEEVPRIMNEFYSQLVNCFILEFKVKEIKGDDTPHQLTIKVNDRGTEAEGFKNFKANKPPFPWWLVILIIILVVALVALFIVLLIITRKKTRAKLGITNRKCPDCKRRLKDDWDECLFCKYLPPKEKKKK